ncbi:exocyst complex component 3 [Synchiropus splendidus]|uniref:exocyst complex component 3 n=1 Tax=Synchiropus splendidus TaxID=270530 RepID=UPI00237E5B74|nr:exocyst complex component 3 [Synchiropus splendidus]
MALNKKRSLMDSILRKNNNGRPNQEENRPRNSADQPEEDHTQDKDIPLDLAILLKLPRENPNRETDGQLIDTHVNQQFKEMGEKFDTNLPQHLRALHTQTLEELLRVTPSLDAVRLGYWLDSYHRKMFIHLHDLLQESSTVQHLLLLFKWVLQTYLSQDLLGHPDLQKVDLPKTVDLMLMTEWTLLAKEKFSATVKAEVGGSLSKILQYDHEQKSCDNVEAFNALHVDVIQCIQAIPEEAKKIGSCLFNKTVHVCFQELYEFVNGISTDDAGFLRKKSEMTKAKTIHCFCWWKIYTDYVPLLGNKSEMTKAEMIQFMRTLTFCQQIKKYVEDVGHSVQAALKQKIITQVDSLKDITMTLLGENITIFLQEHLKKYFTSWRRQSYFTEAITMLFPTEVYCSEVQTRVVNEMYKLTAPLYLKHLVKHKKQLKKRWSSNIQQAVKDDAEQLHSAMLTLADDVEQFNVPLIHASELLQPGHIDGKKMDVAMMSKECMQQSMGEVLQLIPDLLKMAGLSRDQRQEVLNARS